MKFTMKSNARAIALLCSTLGAALSAAAPASVTADEARSLPQTLPPGLQVQALFAGVVQNGIPLTVWQVSANEAPEAMIERFRKEVAMKYPGPLPDSTRAGEWAVFGYPDKGQFIALQLKAESGGASGFLSLQQAAVDTRRLPATLSHPPGTRLLSETLHRDRGRQASTSVHALSVSRERALAHYGRELESAGWTRWEQRAIGPDTLLLYHRENASLELYLSGASGGELKLLLNRIDAPAGKRM